MGFHCRNFPLSRFRTSRAWFCSFCFCICVLTEFLDLFFCPVKDIRVSFGTFRYVQSLVHALSAFCVGVKAGYL
ncbi:Protein of unknown function [Pyronema omphalodes CBS 100304]|uniref:Uncharacterized protein n=1 Tax=Pyronema omphalodes (strain CBS 100304) TaxID=1076935 RepID=U4L0H9_PYROM|nr:Protein of unknown function [Pyronema omphalodes CBS 100304]